MEFNPDMGKVHFGRTNDRKYIKNVKVQGNIEEQRNLGVRPKISDDGSTGK